MSTSGYCIYVGVNIVTCRSKKQAVVARSRAKAEYCAMAHTTSEMLVQSLLHKIWIMLPIPMEMYYDNQ